LFQTRFINFVGEQS